MKPPEVKRLQRALNAFTADHLIHMGPLLVDGDFGHSTRKRVRGVKYYLGYAEGKRDDRADATPDKEFLDRLAHPNDPRYSSEHAVKRGRHRRAEQRKKATDREEWKTAKGFAQFEGRTVAKWMVPWLEKSRRAGWQGSITSGVRTPEYSEHLCEAMCGAPSCPGRCAGRSSNHNMLPSQGHPYGALDVSDYANFEAIQKRIGSPLCNRLDARDPVHFSVSGV